MTVPNWTGSIARAVKSRPRVLRAAARLLELFARCSARRAGLALVYHRVGDRQSNPRLELVPVLATALFEAQLRHLKARYRVVPASELLTATTQRRRGQRLPVAVTFDDDLASHARVALPILRDLGVPATFFLSGSFRKESSVPWWERLQSAFDRGIPVEEILGPRRDLTVSIHATAAIVEAMSPDDRVALSEKLTRLGAEPAEPPMNFDDVKALVTAGLAVGFHTLRHDPLPSLEDDALGRALREGREELEAAVGGKLDLIAYPHGQVDPHVAAAAREAGYRLGFTTKPRAVEPTTDPLLIGRLEPSFCSPADFALRVARALNAHRR